MTELNKHHCSKRIQAWTSAFLLTLAIIAGLIWKTGPAYAAPTNDGREPYTLYFVDQDGNPFIKSDGTEYSGMTKTVRPNKKITVPAIRKKWLPDSTKDDESVTPAWWVPDTDITVYPGDEIWYDDFEDQGDDLVFYLVPDDSTISSDTSSVFFYDADGIEIESYAKVNCKIGKTISLPDPAPYGGKYWSTEDDDGNPHLYKKGDSYRVTDISGEFTVCADRSIAVTYLYPVDQDLADDHSPGDVFYTETVKVGDYITIKNSPGNVVFGCTFRGWTESNDLYSSVVTPGQSLQVLSDTDIEFVAYYEEDPNWDPGAGGEEGMLPDGLTNSTTQQLQENAGSGVNLTLNNNPNDGSYGGRLTKDGGDTTKFGSNNKNNTAWNGNIQSGTKKDQTLTNQEEDQYGRPMDDGGDSTKPLVQDDSLFSMDIYGNAFAYPYWETDEGKRKEIVENRLKQYKGNSWVNFIQKHPELSEAVTRFEEREFELLKDDCTDTLAQDRRSWRGWMDYYSDIPESVTEANTGEDDTWVNNQDGDSNRLLARVKFSNAWDGYTFYQYFYDPTYSTFSSYTFGGMGNGVNTENLTLIYNQLIMKGYSEEAACAICAVIWQNTSGSFSAEYDGSNGKGIWAWNAEDVDKVRSFILQNEAFGLGTEATIDENWKDVQAQTRALDSWLFVNHHDDLNAAIGRKVQFGNTFEFKKIANTQTAVDALCQVFRTGEDTKQDNAIKLPDGKYYKDVEQLRKYASELKKAKTKDASGSYTFDSTQLETMDCSEIRRAICELAKGCVNNVPYKWGASSLDKSIGTDCSGFTKALYAQFGIDLPRKSYTQGQNGVKVSREAARPGDLMVWNHKPGDDTGHVAIYIGNGMAIHAPGRGKFVTYKQGEDSGGKQFLGYYSFFD